MGGKDNPGQITPSRAAPATPAAQVTARGGGAPLPLSYSRQKWGKLGQEKTVAPCPEMNGDLRHTRIRVEGSGARFKSQHF